MAKDKNTSVKDTTGTKKRGKLDAKANLRGVLTDGGVDRNTDYYSTLMGPGFKVGIVEHPTGSGLSPKEEKFQTGQEAGKDRAINEAIGKAESDPEGQGHTKINVDV